MKFHFLKTVRFQLGAALSGQFLFLAGVVGFTLYELDLRRHDYAILNLTGQLRVISQMMVRSSSDYLKQNKDRYNNSKFFISDLDAHAKEYNKIITAFKARRLTPDLTGRDDVLNCNWDENAINQLDLSAAAWNIFRTESGLSGGANNTEAPVTYTAEYVVNNGEILTGSSAKLARSFQLMMEGKLARIRLLLQASIAISILIGIVVTTLLYLKVFKPLNATIKGFDRVGRGDLKYQIPVSTDNEIGFLTRMFNRLTARLDSIFQLTDRVNQAPNLDDTLKFVFEEFREFLPIEWIGWVQKHPGSEEFYLDRVYSGSSQNIPEGTSFERSAILAGFLHSATPTTIDDVKCECEVCPDDAFLTALAAGNLGSAVALPQRFADIEAALVFASEATGAYEQHHIDFLTNIGSQIAHSLEKTIGMEGLVISAIEGLAKLAENRDPETGDHLYRMSRYSAIIIAELGKTEKYKSQISSAFVRNIFRFAPMHDIGKVGVEDRILLKAGILTDEERKSMQRHPKIGADVLRRCEDQMNKVGLSIFQMGIEIAEGHHEKFDGTGYPFGVSGHNIPLPARIVSAADVFDALTSKRPYKEAWQVENALEFIKKESGKSFDPDIVTALVNSMGQILQIYEQYKHV
jgi:HD-GYP domain-containing protein (c-di-GMP phosphodiesterase class II)